MSKIKVGLAPYRNSFYDECTNTYITLDNPIQEISYKDDMDLISICNAVNAKYPALLLYEGKFPKATVEAWQKKFLIAGDEAVARSEKTKKSEEEALEKEEPESPEEIEEEEEDDVEASAVKKTTAKKATAKKATAKKAAAKKTATKKDDKK